MNAARAMVSAAVAVLLAAAAPGCFVPGHFSTQQSPAPVAKKGAARAAESDPDQETDRQAWDAIAAALGKAGDLRDGVFTVVFPRADLEVTFQGNDVPPAAGIESDFRFYRCTCGMINVIGQFVVADYEANDVIDALRQGHMEVASVGPLLLHERPRLLLIRFQGESHHGAEIGRALRNALSWTGPERLAPQKIDPKP